MVEFDLKSNPTPIDNVARRVVYGGGDYKFFRHTSTEKLSTTPLPVRALPQKGMEDFTGRRKGSLVVVGLYNGIEVGRRASGKRRSKPSGHGWVCRCSCGNYTTRKTKSLRKDCYDACIECTSTRNRRDRIDIKVAKR